MSAKYPRVNTILGLDVESFPDSINNTLQFDSSQNKFKFVPATTTIEKSFLSGINTAAQVPIVGEPLKFNNELVSRGSKISLDTVTGKITLEKNTTYKCSSSALIGANGVSGAMNFQWRDETGGVDFGLDASARSQNESAAFSTQPTAIGIIVVGNNDIVIFANISSVSNSIQIFANFTGFLIEEF